jgi:quercetin dioxygenase-like cupin family protein
VADVVKPLTAAGPLSLAPGVRMYPLFGDAVQLNLVDLDPNATVSLHSHPHEQLGYVISGEITMTIGGVDHPLGSGDAYQIPGDVEHGARAGRSGCRVLDIFHPVREDYRELAAGEPSP